MQNMVWLSRCQHNSLRCVEVTMTKRAPFINSNGDVRALTAADLRRFKPAAGVLPPELLKVMGIKPRGPQRAPTKQATTIGLSPDVMAAFKATGAG